MEFKEFEYLMRISFIGAGRVATHLASALCEQHQIIQILQTPHKIIQTKKRKVSNTIKTEKESDDK